MVINKLRQNSGCVLYSWRKWYINVHSGAATNMLLTEMKDLRQTAVVVGCHWAQPCYIIIHSSSIDAAVAKVKDTQQAEPCRRQKKTPWAVHFSRTKLFFGWMHKYPLVQSRGYSNPKPHQIKDWLQ